MGWKHLIFHHQLQDLRISCQKHHGKSTLRPLDTTNSHKFNCCWKRRRTRDRSRKYVSFVQWWWDWVRVHTRTVCLPLHFYLLWSLHSRSSRTPLQSLAEMSPVPMYSSTAHDLFSAARTSSSAHFSPAVNTYLPSSSNSDIMTSTATNMPQGAPQV